jgi:hypothetical protein
MSHLNLIVHAISGANAKLGDILDRAHRQEAERGKERDKEVGEKGRLVPEHVAFGVTSRVLEPGRFVACRVSTPSSPWLARPPRRRGSARGPVWRFAGRISHAHVAPRAAPTFVLHRSRNTPPGLSKSSNGESNWHIHQPVMVHGDSRLTSTMLP